MGLDDAATPEVQRGIENRDLKGDQLTCLAPHVTDIRKISSCCQRLNSSIDSVGVRSTEWTAVGATEVEVLQGMARCLR